MASRTHVLDVRLHTAQAQGRCPGNGLLCQLGCPAGSLLEPLHDLRGLAKFGNQPFQRRLHRDVIYCEKKIQQAAMIASRHLKGMPILSSCNEDHVWAVIGSNGKLIKIAYGDRGILHIGPSELRPGSECHSRTRV